MLDSRKEAAISGKTPSADEGRGGSGTGFFSKLGNTAGLLAAAAFGVSAAQAQTRLPLDIPIGERDLNVTLNTNGTARVAPSGPVRPVAYQVATSAGTTNVVWKALTGTPIGVEDGSVTVGVTNDAALYRAEFPGLTNRNYFLRIPAGLDVTKKLTLCVVLHPLITGSNKAGEWMEKEFGKWLDPYGMPTLYPSAQGFSLSPPVSWWNGDTARGPDLAALEAGIRACKRLVPAIQEVAVVAYSQGTATADGLTKLNPGLVNRLLIIGGTFNGSVAKYVETRNGGPISFEPKIPVVYVAATAASSDLNASKTGASWYAKANGYTNAPVLLPDRLDMHEIPKGLDTRVWQYGDHVRVYETGAPDHDTSLYFTDPAFDWLFRDYARDGKMPGGI